jgi:hypothetical protein
LFLRFYFSAAFMLSTEDSGSDCEDGLHYQVDFGNEQTALISERQVVKD